jgi:hypothetical protein
MVFFPYPFSTFAYLTQIIYVSGKHSHAMLNNVDIYWEMHPQTILSSENIIDFFKIVAMVEWDLPD